MVAEKRIDALVEKREKKPSKNGKDLQVIDINSIRNKDVREIGAEWLSYQAIGQLHMASFLADQGWKEDDIKLAQSHIISRAVYPASELETTRWIKENSSVCELTGYDIEKITKDQLYRISKKLYSHKEALEQHLSVRTNELFDIQDKIMLILNIKQFVRANRQVLFQCFFMGIQFLRNSVQLVFGNLFDVVAGKLTYRRVLFDPAGGFQLRCRINCTANNMALCQFYIILFPTLIS